MNVGNGISAKHSHWSFDGHVANNFVAHAERSIPGYREGHDLVCRLSDFFCQDGSYCYELGCSTGELLRRLAEHNAHKQCHWLGIEREPSMVRLARQHCEDVDGVEIIEADILNHDYNKADFMVAYYVMQFVSPRVRQVAFDLVYQTLNWGGAFVLFEKVRGPDARSQDMLTALYQDFKRTQGFTADEILSKTNSLRGILEPFSTQGNLDLLHRAGFKDVMTIYKNICFEGFIAVK